MVVSPVSVLLFAILMLTLISILLLKQKTQMLMQQGVLGWEWLNTNHRYIIVIVDIFMLGLSICDISNLKTENNQFCKLTFIYFAINVHIEKYL